MRFTPLPSVDVAEVPVDGFLLDVRENDEWAAGHAAGALHIPLSEFLERYQEFTAAAPADGRVHVVCRVGGRSAQVTQYLVEQGVDAVNVEGGMLAWEAAGRELVGEGDEPPRVL